MVTVRVINIAKTKSAVNGNEAASSAPCKSTPADVNGAKPEDVTIGEMGIVPPLVPEGEYILGFVRSEKGGFCGRDRWFLWFAIIEGKYEGEHLYMCCAGPKQNKRTFGLGSKLVAAITLATGRTPRRRDRLSTGVFHGKYFRGVVRTVKTDQDEHERPKHEWYSVIDRLIAIAAGAPA
jgi:hypothetical protein